MRLHPLPTLANALRACPSRAVTRLERAQARRHPLRPSRPHELDQAICRIKATRTVRTFRVARDWLCQVIQSIVSYLHFGTDIRPLPQLLDLIAEPRVLLQNCGHVGFELRRIQRDLSKGALQLGVMQALSHIVDVLQSGKQPINDFEHDHAVLSHLRYPRHALRIHVAIILQSSAARCGLKTANLLRQSLDAVEGEDGFVDAFFVGFDLGFKRLGLAVGKRGRREPALRLGERRSGGAEPGLGVRDAPADDSTEPGGPNMVD